MRVWAYGEENQSMQTKYTYQENYCDGTKYVKVIIKITTGYIYILQGMEFAS